MRLTVRRLNRWMMIGAAMASATEQQQGVEERHGGKDYGLFGETGTIGDAPENVYKVTGDLSEAILIWFE